MSGYKIDQRRVSHRDRQFHFVSYEGTPANVRTGEAATPPTWFLMTAGKRWFVMPTRVGETEADLDSALHAWLEDHIYATPPVEPAVL